MPRPDYKHCKACGGHTETVGPLSHTRLCRGCAWARIEGNYDDLTEHTGQGFRHWRTRLAASVGASLLDDAQAPT